MTPRGLLLIASVLIGGCGASQAEEVTFGGGQGQIEFAMPSQNIGCTYTPAGGTTVYHTADGGAELQCDRVEPTYLRVILSSTGQARLIKNVGDASCCGASNVLRYGQSWSGGPFTCRSAAAGLTCQRGSSGFSLSRATINVF
jgi:hypothetical protein